MRQGREVVGGASVRIGLQRALTTRESRKWNPAVQIHCKEASSAKEASFAYSVSLRSLSA